MEKIIKACRIIKEKNARVGKLKQKCAQVYILSYTLVTPVKYPCQNPITPLTPLENQ